MYFLLFTNSEVFEAVEDEEKLLILYINWNYFMSTATMLCDNNFNYSLVENLERKEDGVDARALSQ